ncbi:MAG TPA: hypothetical protein VGI40_13340 [Pirellulaceae bacterium]
MLRHSLAFVVALGMLFGVSAMPAGGATKVAKANTATARQAAILAARRRHHHHHHKVITPSPIAMPGGLRWTPIVGQVLGLVKVRPTAREDPSQVSRGRGATDTYRVRKAVS